MSKSLQLITWLALLIWQAIGATGVAQNSDCGTVMTLEQALAEQKWQLEKGTRLDSRSEDHFDIPIAAHIVRRSDGTGGLTEAELLAAIDTSNVYAAQTNVSLYLYGGIDYVDADTFFYSTNSSEQFDALRQTNAAPEAVNVYFVPPTDTSGFGYCGLSSFSSSTVQGIILNNQCIDPSYSRSTLFHEVGHYFDLYHTHETWFGTECPSGSNCGAAGDLLCDTPADPDLNGHVSAAPECMYDGYAATPPECDATPYDPPVHNIMSYSRKLCRDQMTPMQNTKFRDVLVTVRTELACGINGLYLRPREIVDLPVKSGTICDTTLRLSYVYNDTVSILSAVSTTGEFQITATLPAAIDNTDTLAIKLTFDAASLVGPCDLGVYSDTIVITTSMPGVSLRVPVSASVTFGAPTYTEKMLGANCFRFNAAVTPAVGNGNDSAMVIIGKNILYDGSLLIAWKNANDTVAYMDAYTRNDYTATDQYTQGVDSLGRITQKTSFITKDGRFSGDVVYTYGWNSHHADSCDYVIVDYTIKNPCNPATTFVTGVFFDYDVDYDYYGDRAWVVAADSMVVVTDVYDSRAGAVVLLHSCNTDQRFKAVDNVQVIWPSGGLTDGYAYRLLVESAATPPVNNSDVSALLSFGSVTLETGDEVSYRYAFVGTPNGPNWLPNTLSNIRSVGGSRDVCPYVCGDASGDASIDISDAVYLIAYIFSGGPAPYPLPAGDANCDSAVDISDAVYLIAYIFSGGPAPCAGCK
jgi:hypothetical protein